MHWIVRNRVFLDSINAQLPEFVTVASVQIYEDCNYEKVAEHLAGPLWRVLLLDGATKEVLDIKLDGYELVVPIPAPSETQDCKLKEEVCAGMHSKGRDPGGGPRSGWIGGWRRLPKRLGAVTVGYNCQ